MAKRPETRAAAAKTSPSRKPARAARPAAKTARATTKTAAESREVQPAKIEKKASRSAAAETATKVAKSVKRAPAAKTKAPAKAHGRAATKAAAPKAKPASAKANSEARTSKAKTGKTNTGKVKAKASKKPKMPRFLAAELGHPVDHDGEPIGAGSRAALGDAELQRYTLQLWRQMQSRRGVNTHIPAMERAGVTIDQIWTAGVTDRLTTSSTPDEVKRYRQKLLFRANLLESIMTETIDELQRLGTIDPTPPPGEPV